MDFFKELTAAAIAREAGADDFLAEATPKDKMDLIKREQAQGKLVAMTGDGTQSYEADRGCRDRQTALDDSRCADDILDCQ